VKLPPKSFLSPFLFATFAVVAVTGLLLFFEVRSAPVKVVHEWLSVLFALVGLLHLILNWRPLAAYFRKRGSWIAILVTLAFTVLFAGAALNHWGPHGHGPEAPAEQEP